METSHQKNDFLRRGISGMAVVLVVAGIFVTSVGFLSLKFKQGDSPASQGFFNRTSALISKTFGDMFSSGQNKPAAEIDLGQSPASGSNREIKNTSSPLPLQQAARYLTEENKNSNSPAENSILQSSASGNNFSVTSSSGSELPTSSNPKTSALSSPALCDFTKIQTPNHKILFSEIAWMGSVKSASDEWIELKNNSGQNLPLRGWQIVSDDGNNSSTDSTSSPRASSPQVKITFDEKNNFPAGTFYLLERSDDNSAPNVTADKIYSGALSNDGVRLRIFNANCELADEIDALKSWPAGDNAGKKTMERSSLDLSWHTSAQVGGTPKAENSTAFSTTGQTSAVSQSGNVSFVADSTPQSSTTLNTTASAISASTSVASTSNPQAPAPTSLSHILISDIQTTGGSGKSNNDFIKMYNAADSAVDIGGWQLKKENASGTASSIRVFPSGASIASRGYFVWANSENNFAGSVGANVSSTAYLTDNNSAALFDSSGKIIDAVAWGSSHVNPFVEGSAYPTNPAANQILGRKIVNAAMQDTDNNAVDFEIK